MKIVIVYHSGYGHTKVVAERIAMGAQKVMEYVHVLDSDEATQNLSLLQEANTIVFGSPTYFGNVSAGFKRFMEATGAIWSKQEWKNKFATGFTNSSSVNGDKLNTLINLSLFAAQHGMIWIPLGIMPEYNQQGKQLAEPNGMASYLGLMTLSDNSHQHFNAPSDLLTAEMFGERIAGITRQFSMNEISLKNSVV